VFFWSSKEIALHTFRRPTPKNAKVTWATSLLKWTGVSGEGLTPELAAAHKEPTRARVNPTRSFGGGAAATQRSQTKPTSDQCSPNRINISVAGLGSIHTFHADEQMPLQGVQFWSFLDHPQTVAFKVGVGEVRGHLGDYIRASSVVMG